MATKIHLVSMHKTTSFAPLGVLGYCVRRTGFLAPVFSELELPVKTVRHSPRAKLIDILVGILSGCRAIEQVNTRIRPDTVLAQAWGRESFAEQSLLADTLDAFDEVTVNQLRHGGEGWLRQNGRLFRHDFATDWLWLDIDLTPLPISKYAEASTKGKFAKKTAMGANWRGSMRHNTTRPSFPVCTQVSRTVVQPTSRCSIRWKAAWRSPLHRSNGLYCAQMLALAATPTSTMR
jgi:hypothetical protein